jgi:H+/Cl- antiporter ClcA
MSFFEIKREFYNLLILMCMIAFLTGVTRTPFTSAVLVLEMTDRHSAIFFFLMAAVIAQFASEKIQRTPIYEILKNRVILDLKKD